MTNDTQATTPAECDLFLQNTFVVSDATAASLIPRHTRFVETLSVTEAERRLSAKSLIEPVCLLPNNHLVLSEVAEVEGGGLLASHINLDLTDDKPILRWFDLSKGPSWLKEALQKVKNNRKVRIELVIKDGYATEVLMTAAPLFSEETKIESHVVPASEQDDIFRIPRLSEKAHQELQQHLSTPTGISIIDDFGKQKNHFEIDDCVIFFPGSVVIDMKQREVFASYRNSDAADVVMTKMAFESEDKKTRFLMRAAEAIKANRQIVVRFFVNRDFAVANADISDVTDAPVRLKGSFIKKTPELEPEVDVSRIPKPLFPPRLWLEGTNPVPDSEQTMVQEAQQSTTAEKSEAMEQALRTGLGISIITDLETSSYDEKVEDLVQVVADEGPLIIKNEDGYLFYPELVFYSPTAMELIVGWVLPDEERYRYAKINGITSNLTQQLGRELINKKMHHKASGRIALTLQLNEDLDIESWDFLEAQAQHVPAPQKPTVTTEVPSNEVQVPASVAERYYLGLAGLTDSVETNSTYAWVSALSKRGLEPTEIIEQAEGALRMIFNASLVLDHSGQLVVSGMSNLSKTQYPLAVIDAISGAIMTQDWTTFPDFGTNYAILSQTADSLSPEESTMVELVLDQTFRVVKLRTLANLSF